jgi:hypothetical protein
MPLLWCRNSVHDRMGSCRSTTSRARSRCYRRCRHIVIRSHARLCTARNTDDCAQACPSPPRSVSAIAKTTEILSSRTAFRRLKTNPTSPSEPSDPPAEAPHSGRNIDQYPYSSPSVSSNVVIGNARAR